jgi:catechol 2,3-dioxygenase
MTHLITQLGHITFVTPHPEQSGQDLFDLIGLRVSGRRDGTVFLTSNQRLYEIAFRGGVKSQVAAVGLEAIVRRRSTKFVVVPSPMALT